MKPDLKKLDDLLSELGRYQAKLIAVSKTKPVETVQLVYDHGQRDFGENYVQELIAKKETLSAQINWHFIGHLQSNKVKLIAPFVHLIHGIDSVSLLKEVSRQAVKLNREIPVLLQVHIATEETKFGLSPDEVLHTARQFFSQPMPGITLNGLMGMASFTEDENLIRKEFKTLKKVFDTLSQETVLHQSFSTLSMGMSNDYKIALDEGSNMIRIGSAIFGSRN